jgi:class 3 adenylate cyclase
VPSLPTGTVTFLFTDIEGSTRLPQQLGDRYAEVLATHHRLLRAAIQDAQGQVVDTQGDAVFAAFPRARDALLEAVVAQRAVQAHPWPDGIAPKVRGGLHAGEPGTVSRKVDAAKRNLFGYGLFTKEGKPWLSSARSKAFGAIQSRACAAKN